MCRKQFDAGKQDYDLRWINGKIAPNKVQDWPQLVLHTGTFFKNNEYVYIYVGAFRHYIVSQ